MTVPLKTIAVAENEMALCQTLQKAIVRLGYEIAGVAGSAEEAFAIVKLKQPHLILMDVHLPLLDGLEAPKKIIALQRTAIVLLTEEGDPILARQGLDLGICGYVLKPFDPSQIGPVMEMAWHRFQTVTDLQTQISALNETLETRKLLEKAKGILIEQQGFTEESAHQTIRKMSQDQGIAIKEVCRSIIQVKMVLGKMAPKRVV
jgi:two-component system, response regulator PdtaR